MKLTMVDPVVNPWDGSIISTQPIWIPNPNPGSQFSVVVILANDSSFFSPNTITVREAQHHGEETGPLIMDYGFRVPGIGTTRIRHHEIKLKSFAPYIYITMTREQVGGFDGSQLLSFLVISDEKKAK